MRVLLLAALIALPVSAQDLPDPGMPEGAVQTAAADQGYDVYELPVGRFTSWVRAVLPLEGRVISRAFRYAAPDASTASVLAILQEGLEAQGFTAMFACENAGCGGYDFRFGIAVVPAPAMLLDLADFRQLSMVREVPAKAHVSVLVSRALGAIYGQTVVVLPADSPVARVEAPPVAEVAGPQALPPVADEGIDLLLDRLNTVGHVVVNGLDFETGAAALSDASAPVLDLLARMLVDNPALAVAVVGHSDNEGGLAPNIKLSRERAQAVVDALVERGVAGSRLEAEGVGYLAPLAPNSTPEGRAVNRRVELVLR